MRYVNYKPYNEHSIYKRNAFKKNLFIFLIFLSVVTTIFLSVDQNFEKSTGKSIISTNETLTINFDASLSIPKITLKNNFPELNLIIEKNSTIRISGKNFTLKSPEQKISIKDFQGIIIFDENYIYSLKGKASQITIGNTQEINADKTKIEFELYPKTPYKLIEIPQSFFIKSLEYYAWGHINAQGNILSIAGEKIKLENYFGNLKAQEKKLFFKGEIQQIQIIGEDKKIIVS